MFSSLDNFIQLSIRILFVLFCWWSLSCGAEVSATARFHSLWLEDGLPDRLVDTIYQDSQGYMWFGTGTGLSRYDGNRIKSFSKHTHQLTDDYISDIVEDNQNRLWIGTRNGGVNIYDPTKNSFQSLESLVADTSSLFSNRIRALTITNEQLWIGTQKGLNRLNLNNYELEQVSLPFNDKNVSTVVKVLAFTQDSKNNLWIGTNKGLLFFDNKKQKISIVKLGSGKQPVIKEMLLTAADNLWIASQSGLYHLDISTAEVVHHANLLPDPVVTTLTGDQQGNLWAGTLRNGLFKIDQSLNVSSYQFDRSDFQSIRSNNILDVYQDRNGNLWIGSFGGGVNWFNPRSLQFGLLQASSKSVSCMNSPVVLSSFVDSDKSLWIGTMEGLVHYDYARKKCHSFRKSNDEEHSLLSDEINAILKDRDRVLWVATARGLSWFDKESQQFFHADKSLPRTRIYQIKLDNYGSLVVATAQGVFVKERNSKKFILVPSQDIDFLDVMIQNFVVDKKNIIWIATDYGLAKIDTDRTNTSWFKFAGTEFPKPFIRALDIDADDHLWITIENVGVIEVDNQGKQLNRFTPQDGLSSYRNFASLTIDKQQSVWVAGTNGVDRINTSSGKIQNFSRDHGLQSNIFNLRSAYIGSSGEILLGGWKGLNWFDPKKIESNLESYDSMLADFFLFNEKQIVANEYSEFKLNKPVNLEEKIELSHKEMVFGFELASTNYKQTRNEKFAYKMEGFEQNWSYTDGITRRITYTNIPAGNYVFRYKSINVVEPVKSIERQLDIVIHPAPWKSNWAYFLYSLLVASILYFGYSFKIRRTQLRSLQLEQEVANRTREIESQKQVIRDLLEKKNDLFANVSHEFRTPLTLILGPLKKLQSQISNRKHVKQISLIQRNASRLMLLVDQLLAFASVTSKEIEEPTSHNLSKKLDFLIQSFRPLAIEKDIRLQVKLPDGIQVAATSDAVELVFVNLLSNAVKYTPLNGKICVDVESVDEFVRIRVSNSGDGIPKDQLENIFERFTRLSKHVGTPGAGIGLAVVKELIDANLASITVKSETGSGTSFIVDWPLAKESDGLPSISVNEAKVTELIDLLDDESLPLGFELDGKASSYQSKREVVLIIEDNLDMQNYLVECLSPYFDCLRAIDGETGINIAVKEVPDLIVSDLMMPGKDGYEVIKEIRSNELTSHIPITLLTAKGDSSSRVKGWLGLADDYIVKPFDDKELILRIRNLLVIRNILNKKVSSSKQLVDDKTQFELPEIDKKFLAKVEQIIESCYQDAGFTRKEFAQRIAMSERQLQRKLKAITDLNPSEYLRNYRLKMSAEKLQQGYQVGLVSEECGFTSAVHFTRCFKAAFNVSPKQYQTNYKNRVFQSG